jgi:hypothetical protein
LITSLAFNHAGNLPKWDAAGRMKERNHHYLHSADVYPSAGNELLSVQVTKSAPAYLVFWGAPGVTADQTNQHGFPYK